MGFLFIEGYRSIFGKALYALKMTKEIVISVIIAASISVILNFILGYYFGYIGLAFAFAFTNFFHMFFYYLFLFKAIPQFKHIFYDAVSFKILFSALIMGVVCFFTLTFMNRALVLYTKLEQCIRISMVFFISILSYLIIARLYKIHEVKIFDSYVQKVMTNIQRILLGAKV
jgi:peptidoglycan biosynthesis protein MviN/MurJ (putative lipid II flippase)